MHGSHPSWPESFWKLPGSQRSHAGMLAFGATVPGLHAVWRVLPVGAKWPGSVGVHSAALVRLVAVEYEPSRHGSAAEAPTSQ